MSDYFFAFGPGDTYLFSGPRQWSMNGKINKYWEDYAIGTGSKGITSIECYATNEDQDTFAVWTNKADNPRHWLTYSLEHRDGIKQVVKREGHKTRIAMNAGKHFVAWSTYSRAMEWWLTPKSWAFGKAQKVVDLAQRLKCVALGVEDASFFMLTDDRFWYDLDSNYNALEAVLADLRAGDIEFLALNPFRVEQFFLLRADNVAIFRVSLAFRDDLLDLLAKHGIRCQDLSSQRAQEGRPSLPSSTQNSTFLKGIAKSVASQGVVGGIISGVASALVGAAACNVM